MNARVVAILALLGLIVGGLALFMYQREQVSQPAASARFGQTLLKDLKASEVASIVIREPKATLTLVKKENRWTLAEKNGFPADLDKVTDLVVKAIELKVGQAEPIAEKDRARLNLVDPGKSASPPAGAATALAFKAADGRVLAELWLGNKYFKKEPEGDAAKAPADGRFIMLPTEAAQVFIVSEPFRLASTASVDWIAKEGFAIERVKSLEARLAAGEGYSIARAVDGPDWKLDRAGGLRLDNSKANSAAYALAKIEIEDLAASDKPEDYGLDKPSVLTASTFDGLTYTLRVGRLENNRYPVRVEVEGVPKREFEERKDEKPEAKTAREKSFAEEMARLQERVAREKALKDHTLLVAKGKLDAVLKPKSELLQQKQADAKKR